MLYLIGRIKLLETVIASLSTLLTAIWDRISEKGGRATPDNDIVAMATECYVASNASTTTLDALQASVIDAILDLAHQLHSLEEDIRYERTRLLDEEITELRKSYWVARMALEQTLDGISARSDAKIPKLNPDPFSAELNLGLF